MGEVLAPLIKPFLKGSLASYRPISAAKVAEAMVAVAQSQILGPQIFLSAQIQNHQDIHREV
jgi:hypothetical protein